jgi:hypothetical protein
MSNVITKLTEISRISNDPIVYLRMRNLLVHYEMLENNPAAEAMLDVVDKFYMFCSLLEDNSVVRKNNLK